MEPKFNLNRPKLSDEEINKHKNFDQLVKQFKQQSIDKAKYDKSWWKSKKVRYTAIITGTLVICTISYLDLFKNNSDKAIKHETNLTPKIQSKKSSVKKSVISEPSAKLKINYTSYKINNAKGGEIKHTTSSKIKVPANSFVDKNGKDIIGDVTIDYREFHDAADIIVSGIPMIYDSAGKKFNLESAGMFDVKGSQKGEPVFIKKNKQLNIELTSTVSENRFNQYYLDTVSKNWQYLKRDDKLTLLSKTNKLNSSKINHSISSPKLENLKNQIEVVIPRKLDSVKIVYAKKQTLLSKPKEPLKPNKPSPGRPTFVFDGSYQEFPELSVFNNVVFEVGEENKNYRSNMHDITWTDVKISEGPVKGKNYLLTLVYRRQVEKLIVYPTLTGKDFELAEKNYNQKFNEYKVLIEKREAQEKKLVDELQAKQTAYFAELTKKQKELDNERSSLIQQLKLNEQKQLNSSFNTLSNQTKATRLFSISQFGIYNSDCPHNENSGKIVNPVFVSHDNTHVVNPDALYLINHSSKTVTNISFIEGFKFIYDPSNSYSICVFSKNKLFICSKGLFEKAVNNNKYQFTLHEITDNTESVMDLKKALEI